MKKTLLLAMLLAAVLVTQASPAGAQVLTPPTFGVVPYYGSQMDALNVIAQKAIDSPPYYKGNLAINATGTSFSFGFRANTGRIGYYCYSYVMLPSSNTGDTNVSYFLNGVLRRVLPLRGGANIADFVVCDSIYATKTVGADVICCGGYYNRP